MANVLAKQQAYISHWMAHVSLRTAYLSLRTESAHRRPSRALTTRSVAEYCSLSMRRGVFWPNTHAVRQEPQSRSEPEGGHGGAGMGPRGYGRRRGRGRGHRPAGGARCRSESRSFSASESVSHTPTRRIRQGHKAPFRGRCRPAPSRVTGAPWRGLAEGRWTAEIRPRARWLRDPAGGRDRARFSAAWLRPLTAAAAALMRGRGTVGFLAAPMSGRV